MLHEGRVDKEIEKWQTKQKLPHPTSLSLSNPNQSHMPMQNFFDMKIECRYGDTGGYWINPTAIRLT